MLDSLNAKHVKGFFESDNEPWFTVWLNLKKTMRHCALAKAEVIYWSKVLTERF